MNRNHSFFFFVCIFCCFVSCKKQSPQLPSNKGNVADKNVVALLAINQKLALNEDSVIQEYAERDVAFKKSELGFWYKIEKTSQSSLVKDKDICKFTCKLMLINGKVIQEDEKQVIIGKKQVVTGLEEGLKLMHKGESATFIIPSYLGFGMKGNMPLVPPYTSLVYQIKLYK